MAVRSPVSNKPFIARFGIAPRKPEHRIFYPPGTPSMTTTPFVALRLARALAGKEEQQVRVFLMADAVFRAKSGQKVPEGCYNTQLMLGQVVSERNPRNLVGCHESTDFHRPG
jgi:hypothetical protein